MVDLGGQGTGGPDASSSSGKRNGHSCCDCFTLNALPCCNVGHAESDILDRLRSFVAASRISHTEIAAHIEIDATAFSKVLHGKRRLSTLELALFCERLNVDPSLVIVGHPWTDEEIAEASRG